MHLDSQSRAAPIVLDLIYSDILLDDIRYSSDKYLDGDKILAMHSILIEAS